MVTTSTPSIRSRLRLPDAPLPHELFFGLLFVTIIVSLLVAGVASWAVLAAAGDVAPRLVASVGRGVPAVAGSLFGFLAVALVATRRYRAARFVVGALAATVVLGWAVAKGEVLVWAEHTLVSSRAHPATLQWLLVICVGAAVLVLPSLALLFTAFGRRAVKS